MAAVSVTNIKVLNNPCPLNAPFLFEIHFEAQQALEHDVEWRVVYVGSGEHHSAPASPQKEKAAAAASGDEIIQADGEGSNKTTTALSSGQKKSPSRGADYVLDSVMLGPIERGALAFEFAVNAPDFTQMDPGSVEGMQAVLVCGLYRGKEFVRIGYYLNNAYSDPTLRECPPEKPIYERLVRCVVDAPRVTRFQIEWDDEEPNPFSAGAMEAPKSDQRLKTDSAHSEAKTNALPAAPSPPTEDVSQENEILNTKSAATEASAKPKGPTGSCISDAKVQEVKAEEGVLRPEAAHEGH